MIVYGLNSWNRPLNGYVAEQAVIKWWHVYKISIFWAFFTTYKSSIHACTHWCETLWMIIYEKYDLFNWLWNISVIHTVRNTVKCFYTYMWNLSISQGNFTINGLCHLSINQFEKKRENGLIESMHPLTEFLPSSETNNVMLSFACLLRSEFTVRKCLIKGKTMMTITWKVQQTFFFFTRSFFYLSILQ